MSDPLFNRSRNARQGRPRRAFSLMELTAVVFMLGLFAAMGAMRFGKGALAVTDAEGFVRKMMLDFKQARHRTIATGVNHALRFNRAGGDVVSYSLLRVPTSGPSTQIDETVLLPEGVAVNPDQDHWELEFNGGFTDSTTGRLIEVTDSAYEWTLEKVHLAGRLFIDEKAD